MVVMVMRLLRYIPTIAAAAVALYVFVLWALNSELSYMALFLRYWYLFAAMIALAVIGATLTAVE
jgi:hypothetical protein